jgi:hypothetical protein
VALSGDRIATREVDRLVIADAGASLLDVANRRGRALLRQLHPLWRAVAIGRSHLQLRTTRGIDRSLTRRIDAELALDDVQRVSGALSGDCDQRRAAEQPTRQENGRPARAEKAADSREARCIQGCGRIFSDKFKSDPGAPPCRWERSRRMLAERFSWVA